MNVVDACAYLSASIDTALRDASNGESQVQFAWLERGACDSLVDTGPFDLVCKYASIRVVLRKPQARAKQKQEVGRHKDPILHPLLMHCIK